MSALEYLIQFPNGQRLEIRSGDLTEETVDAIVNAANSQLSHGGGIAAAIAHQGGAQIDRESRQWVKTHGPVTHDQPAYTRAGNLPCRYVIHAVGPVWGSGNEENKLASALNGSLMTAEMLALTSIAFPAISTGIFRFPLPLAAQIFSQTIQGYFKQHPLSPIRLVRVVLFDSTTLEAFLTVFSAAQPAGKNK